MISSPWSSVAVMCVACIASDSVLCNAEQFSCFSTRALRDVNRKLIFMLLILMFSGLAEVSFKKFPLYLNDKRRSHFYADSSYWRNRFTGTCDTAVLFNSYYFHVPSQFSDFISITDLGILGTNSCFWGKCVWNKFQQ
jgi:hypothetical protein